MNAPDPYGAASLPHSAPPFPHIAKPGYGHDNQQPIPYPDPQLMPQIQVPPMPQMQIPQAAYPVMMGPHPPTQMGPVYSPVPGAPKQNSMSMASLILGLVAMFCVGPLAGIPAIITGVMARKQIADSGGTQTGSGQAMAGIVLGAIATVLTVFGLVIWFIVIIAAAGAGEPPLY